MTTIQRILVTGAKGRLGGALVEALSPHYEAVIGVDSAEFDISNFEQTRQFVQQVRPSLVIHPAAWTDVDGCARDPERAIQVNGFGAQNVALAAAAVDAPIVHISTNEVFDGNTSRPYREYDTPNPVNAYGYSKFVGEQAVMRVNPRHYVVRIAWLFAHGGKNFIHTILGAVAANKPLRIVTDEVANPTYNDDLVAALGALIQTERYGIYHLVNSGACSRYAFARYVLDRAGYAETRIAPISRHEWQRDSVPPLYTPLANLACAQVNIQMRDWQQAVDAFLAREGLLVE